MPEEPVCKLAPLIDRFQKIGELVTSIGGSIFRTTLLGPQWDRMQSTFQFTCSRFFSASTYSRAFGISSAHQERPLTRNIPRIRRSSQYVLFEVGVLRIKDAILNVVGGGSSHREPCETAEGEYLASHQVEDIFPHLMYSAAVPFFFRQGIQQIKVFMVSIHKQGGEGFLSQPVQPMLVFLAAVPQPPKSPQMIM